MSNKNNPFKGLAHMCIQTQDNEKSIDFYCNAMGFEIYDREMMGTHEEPKRMFPAEFCLVKLGNLFIELIQCFGPWNDTPQDKKHPGVLGVIDHFGIEVDNVDDAVAQLKEWGYEGELSVQTNTISYGVDRPFRYCCVKGPDGESINLYELNNEKFFKGAK